MSMFDAAPVIGQYTRLMTNGFNDETMIQEPTLFQSMFGRNGGETVITDSLNIEFDTRRGFEKVAKMVKRGIYTRDLGGNFKNNDSDQFVSTNLAFGLMKEETDIDNNQTFKRMFNENAYDQRARLDRLRKMAAERHLTQVKRMVRKDEILASQSIILGQQEVLDGTADPNFIYDWQRNALLTFAAANPWNGGSQDIVADLDAAGIALRKYGKVRGDIAILGDDAMDALIKDSDVQATATNRRYELIEVSQKFPVPAEYAWLEAAGAVPYGMFKTNKGYKLWLFMYPEYYQTDAGTYTKYMPGNKVLVMSSKAVADRYFGPSDILPIPALKDQLYQQMLGLNPNAAPMPVTIKNPSAVIVPESFYFDMYLNNQHTILTMRAEHAPIFAPKQTDAYCVLTSVVS